MSREMKMDIKISSSFGIFEMEISNYNPLITHERGILAAVAAIEEAPDQEDWENTAPPFEEEWKTQTMEDEFNHVVAEFKRWRENVQYVNSFAGVDISALPILEVSEDLELSSFSRWEGISRRYRAGMESLLRRAFLDVWDVQVEKVHDPLPYRDYDIAVKVIVGNKEPSLYGRSAQVEVIFGLHQTVGGSVDFGADFFTPQGVVTVWGSEGGEVTRFRLRDKEWEPFLKRVRDKLLFNSLLSLFDPSIPSYMRRKSFEIPGMRE